MSLPAGMLGSESKSGLQPLVKVCPGLLRRGGRRGGEWTGGCTQKWAGTQIRRRPWSLSTTNNNFSVHTHTNTLTHTVQCTTANSYKRNPAIKKELTAAANNSISCFKKMPNCEANWSCAAAAAASAAFAAFCPLVVQKPNGGASWRVGFAVCGATGSIIESPTGKYRTA